MKTLAVDICSYGFWPDVSQLPALLQVRLQELLGSTDIPAVARNTVPLQLELLSPAFRPVQRTNDLQSFWQAGYKSVRKELRAKYPKHFWPEDPLNCDPIKGSMRPKKKGA